MCLFQVREADLHRACQRAHFSLCRLADIQDHPVGRVVRRHTRDDLRSLVSCERARMRHLLAVGDLLQKRIERFAFGRLGRRAQQGLLQPRALGRLTLMILMDGEA